MKKIDKKYINKSSNFFINDRGGLRLPTDKSDFIYNPNKSYFEAKTDNIFFKDEEFLNFAKEKIKIDLKDVLLHEECFISGGYILGIMMEYLGLSENKSRDIDIFYDINKLGQQTELKEFIEKEKEGDFYFFLEKSDEYIILDQWKESKINYIKMVSGAKNTWRKFLKDFDLNCVLIGIIFNKGEYELIYTDEFIHFLHTKEILIHNNEILNSSIPRAIRKVQQYDFVNFNYYFFLKQFTMINSNFFKNNEIDLRKGASEENNELFRSELEKDKNFKIISDEKVEVLLNYNTKEYAEIFSFFTSYLVSQNYPFLKKKEYERAKFLKNKIEEFENNRKVINAWNYIHNEQKVIYLFVSRYKLLFQDVKKIDIDFFFKFIIKNNTEYLQKNIIKMIYDIESFSSFIKLLRSINKNNNLLSFLESGELRIDQNLSYQRLMDQKYIYDVKNMDIKKRYRPLNLNSWIAKYIVELLSEQDFIDESRKMKHCISGYWKRALKCEIRVFHIYYNGCHSTVSMNYKDGRIIQHKSISNSNPEKMNHQMIKILSKNFFYF